MTIIRSRGSDGAPYSATRDISDFDELALPIMIADHRGSVTNVNMAWSRETGLSHRRSIGSGWLSAVDPHDAERLLAYLRESGNLGEAEFIECRLVGRRGPRWTRWWRKGDGDGFSVCVVDIDDDKQRETLLFEQATHDSLTGLVNRRLFIERVAQSLRRLTRDEGSVAVLFIDLDDFKRINDRVGHLVGDRVLATIGGRIGREVRPADVAARVGGDEFAILCENLGDQEAQSVAKRIISVIGEPVGSDSHRLTASAGVATSRAPDEDAESLLERADCAMYDAKRSDPSSDGGPRWGSASAWSSTSRIAEDDLLQPDVEPPTGPTNDLVRHVYSAGLTLRSCAELTHGSETEHLLAAIDHLDRLVTATSYAAFRRRQAGIEGPQPD